MAINYDLTPVNILKILGFDASCSRNSDICLNNFEEEHKYKIPECLKEFMKLAIDNPLFETADFWTQSDSFWTCLYHEIELMNEDDDQMYPEFVKTPKDEWNRLVPDYLEIGSDYAAGVVTYGICVDDILKDNPPVYAYNEDDDITEWNKEWETVSDYLMTVICDILLEFQYDTASCVLEDKEFTCECYEDSHDIEEIIEKYNIDISKLHKVKSDYVADPDNEYTSCCYNENEKMLFVFYIGEDESKVYTYCKNE